MTMSNKCMNSNVKASLLTGTLFVSVILNLFLAGVLVGGVPGSKHGSFAPMALASPHGEYLVDGMTRYLDQSDAQTFREEVKDQASFLKQAHDQVHQATKDVAIAFEQEPPNKEALQTALDRLSEARAHLDSIVGTIVQEGSTKISADGRHRLAELAR